MGPSNNIEETRGGNQGGKMAAFTNSDFGDVDEILPDAGEGEYTARASVSAKPNKDGYPMLTIVWKIRAVNDGNEENEKFIGSTVTDWLVFSPNGTRSNRMTKLKLQDLLAAGDIDKSLVPTSLKGKKDLDELSDGIKGLEMAIWVKHEQRDGETQCRVLYKAPRSSFAVTASTDDDEVEERTQTRAKTAPKKSASARRR